MFFQLGHLKKSGAPIYRAFRILRANGSSKLGRLAQVVRGSTVSGRTYVPIVRKTNLRIIIIVVNYS